MTPGQTLEGEVQQAYDSVAGQLEVLDDLIPTKAGEGSTKRRFYVRRESVSAKLDRLKGALDVFKVRRRIVLSKA
jgi:hypothetical protein